MASKKRKVLTPATMGPGKERFASADLSRSAGDFVAAELAKAPAARFEAVCFDARRAPLPEILEWIRALDVAQDAADADPKNERGYFIRRVVILKSARVFKAQVPEDWRERADIAWIATTDPSDGPTIYRRHVTEQFKAALSLFKRPPKRGR